ncbi:MAG: hypothetical protein A2445_00905 [Candidatus Jacksonbacteria bacterium RIFOXYC2_FULL_44_29]|nr:MAG: internalization-related competence protein ComEC/Rec2 protein [Parcubacteria group bacterium GW2011_GWC2_44_22]OGY75059.1 MAG: hypothetical protein A2240_00625 [Candidatus Jacksonbacteria bacterium RIFOXYA2_FULL_43_12]OGY76639.1 MAG: hypothetical protein A2295_00915 [Candidatus Jacksonbacteria bacterium RIFOXYB2_FULL_44_15]OGY79486.1 MAG: hypothetical protein A2445_00905 [Candidatus Jacksonbacteria bacterium RIFOXYC2_FULL_44_29]OGY79976.1 MAG: hypothetical protein A2550_05560 [Candidatu
MFYLVTLSFLFGVGLHSFLDFDIFYLFILLLGFLVAYGLNRKKWWLRGITIAVIFLFLGYARFDLATLAGSATDAKELAAYNGQGLILIGQVQSPPEVGEGLVKYTLGDIRSIKTVGYQDLRGKLLVTANFYPRFRYGDWLRLHCRLKKPEVINGFAYDKYLAKDGIYSLCYYPESIEAVNYINQNLSATEKVKQALFSIKNKFIVQINKILPAPHSGLLAGLLLGETSGLPEYLKQSFIDTGTIHIVAISGYNITIIIGLFFLIAPYLYISRRWAWMLILPALFIFVILTGATGSVVRAAIMGLIAALSTSFGRLSDVRRLLVITALIMVAINPYILRFDVGFQLSFLATVGLVYFTPRLDQVLERLKEWLSGYFGRQFGILREIESESSAGRVQKKWLKRDVSPKKTPVNFWGRNLKALREFSGQLLAIIRQSATTTIGANLAVAPVLLWQFGRISLISPVVNVLILWTIPIIMALGFVAAIISFLWLPLGQVAGWLSWALLEYIIEVVKVTPH